MRGYVAEEVPGDGSCLFHSLGRHVGARGDTLRAQVVDVLRRYPDLHIQDTRLRDWTAWYAEAPIDQYVRHIARPGTWGGALEMAVLSRLYRRPIHVYEPTPGFTGCRRISTFCVDDARGGPMRLLYMGRSHYMPLFPQT